jgi:hypothetical protein
MVRLLRWNGSKFSTIVTVGQSVTIDGTNYFIDRPPDRVRLASGNRIFVNANLRSAADPSPVIQGASLIIDTATGTFRKNDLGNAVVASVFLIIWRNSS